MEIKDLRAHEITFESYGVNITLQSSNISLLWRLRSVAEKCLLGAVSIIENPDIEPDGEFRLEVDSTGKYFFYDKGEMTNYGDDDVPIFRYFDAMLRLAVAERAEDRVFVHAGVVGWKGKAVVIPALSHTGKTSLVASLISQGATYFSDEYAVIDLEGNVHPFPRPLSIRASDEERMVSEVPVDNFGCEVATSPAKVGAVLLTAYEEGFVWKPEILSLGQGILESLSHAIPLNKNAGLSIQLLSKAFENATIAKSKRGDVGVSSLAILDFLDKHLN